MLQGNWKNQLRTIPNLLSLFRLVLIPVYILIYLNAKTPGHYVLAAAVLAISCFTDMLDGKIARKYNLITTLGKILDPVADKATQFSLILCLSIRHPALRPVVLLFIIKEGFQLIAGILALSNGKMLPGALFAGKLCTTIMFLSLIILVLLPGLGEPVVNLIAGLDALFLTISFVSYILAYYGKHTKTQDMNP